MIGREKIAELRAMVSRDASPGRSEQARSDLMREVGPHLDELLALADIVLYFRETIQGAPEGAMVQMITINGAVRGAMMKLDALEREAERAAGITPIHDGRQKK